jgi:hypothetical protein
MTTTNHSHKAWTDKRGHVSAIWLSVASALSNASSDC